MLNYELSSSDSSSESNSLLNVPLDIKSNPFPGLRPFTVDQCHLFFGREGQVDEILLKLAENRFVGVMGYSGSGKSSLMYCGLIPVLYGGFVTNVGPNWNVIVTRPGFSPIENLADSLLRSDPDYSKLTDEEKLVNHTALTAILRSDRNAIVHLLKNRKQNSGENFMLMVDQFEELFRYEEKDEFFDDARSFVSLILEACQSSELPLYLAITMRSDYIGECAKFPGLTQIINRSNYLVPQMTRDQLRMAIEGPVAVGGGRISQNLVKRLLNELGDNKDQLPILQHALMRTWDYWVKNHEEGEPMDLRHYNAVGQISEALSLHANEAYDELGSKEKRIAEVLFKALTEKTNEGAGRRRPVKLGLVAELADASVEEVIGVIDQFRQPGRSFLMPSAEKTLSSDSVIEISHESLMRIWTRLKIWVDEEFESAQMYRRLSEAAAMYQIGRTGLWRPPDLQLALNWQQKQMPTRAWAQRYDEAFERAIVFLETSKITYEAEQRNQELLQKRLLKRTKIVAVVLGMAAVIAILFFVFALTQQIEAETQKELADERRIEAEEQRQEAEEQRREAETQREAALKAEMQAKIDRDKAVAAQAQAEYERARAQEQFLIAERQRGIANSERQIADNQRVKAELATAEAQRNFELANQLLYQSVAQSMAVKSVNIEEDNLKGLLAQQAYLFNTNYKGRTYDPYIYNGLYVALDQLKGKELTTHAYQHRNAARAIALTDDGRIFSTGTAGNVSSSTVNGTSANNILNNDHPNRVLALDDAEILLVVGSDSSYLQVINLGTKEIKQIRSHASYVNDIEFLSSSTVLSVGGDRNLVKTNIATGDVETIHAFTNEPKSMAINPGKNKVVMGTIDGQVIIQNLSTNEQQIIQSSTGYPIHTVTWNHKGNLLVVGDERGVVKIYDTQKGAWAQELAVHKGRISDLEFSSDDKLLASASFDRTISMWSMEEIGELPIRMTDNDAYVWDIEFTSDDSNILAANGDGEIRIWPTQANWMADQMCDELERNLSGDEWETYVGNGIPFENTCLKLLLNDY